MYSEFGRVIPNSLLSAARVLITVLLSACSNEHMVDSSRWVDTHLKTTSNLETAAPQAISYVEDMQFYSVLTGFNSTTKTFLESGRIKSIHVVEGQAVNAGEMLGVMYSPSLPEELSEAEAALRKAKADMGLKMGDYKRSVQLLEKHLISLKEFEEIKRDFDVSLLEIEEANAKAEKIANSLSSLEVVALEDGVVGRIFKRSGDFLNKGEPLLQFESIAKQKAIFEVPERVSISIQRGQQQRLFFPALDRVALATVIEKASPNSGGLPLHRITLELDEPDRELIGLSTVLLMRQGVSFAYKVDYRAIRYSKNNDPYVIKVEDSLVGVSVDVIDIDQENVIVGAKFADSDSILVGGDITVPVNLYDF